MNLSGDFTNNEVKLFRLWHNSLICHYYYKYEDNHEFFHF
jgi:hypothetical protein